MVEKTKKGKQKMKNKNQNKFSRIINRKSISLFEIFILVTGIFAFGWILGGEVRVVSAAEEGDLICGYEDSKNEWYVLEYSTDGCGKGLVDCPSGLVKGEDNKEDINKDKTKSEGWKLTGDGTPCQGGCQEGECIPAEEETTTNLANPNIQCKTDQKTLVPEISPGEQKCDDDWVVKCDDKGLVTSESCSGKCEVGTDGNAKCVPADSENLPSDGTSAPVPSFTNEMMNMFTGLIGKWGGASAQGCGENRQVEKDQYYNKNYREDGKVTTLSENQYNALDGDKRAGFIKAEKGFCAQGKGAWGARLLGGVLLGGVLASLVQLGKLSGQHAGLYDSLSKGLGIGGTVYGVFGAAQLGGVGLGVGAFTAMMVFLATYHEEKQVKFTFESLVWEPPLGGEACELCNQVGDLPCSEYQCKSLGKGCQLMNPGTSEELCVWLNRKDVNPPVIKPWEGALPSGGYKYNPDNTISPPDTGVKIVYEQGSKEGCIEPFTPITFGITTDEPSTCKIDYERKDNFTDFAFYLGGSNTMKYNHTQYLSLPKPTEVSDGNLTIINGKDYSLFMKCQDANGITSPANFVVKFCVDDGPDTTAPKIVATDPQNNLPISFNTTELDVNVYTNEPALCKWDHADKVYQDMANPMEPPIEDEFNGQALYMHKASLSISETGDKKENKFYFRCEDKATPKPNINTQSYVYTLISTKPMSIISVEPNGTIQDSTTSVKVTLKAKTLGGYDDGKSLCSFSQTGEIADYTQFYNTDAAEHSQDIFLSAGVYTYFIRCVDLGGNADVKSTTFEVETDTQEPQIVRAYYDAESLRIITDEEASCVYDTLDCNYQFKDGIAMTAKEKTNHFVEWNSHVKYFVKCSDKYENQPNPDECSVVVKPFSIYTPDELAF